MAAYTYRATGTAVSSSSSAALSPGAPAGKATGDLLLLFTGNRASSETLGTLTGWTQLALFNSSNGSIALYARIADGTGTDTPTTVDWSGTNDAYAWIEAYYGDVYTDLATIIAHSAANENTSSSTGVNFPSLTITTVDTLVIAFGHKSKTATSNDATTITTGGGITKRTQLILTGTSVAAVSGSLQQTTAANYDGTNATINGTSEGLGGTGLVISLKTTGAAPPTTAYTYRATGTIASNSTSAVLSPGAPAGKSIGDLLLLFTGNRSAAQTLGAITGWTSIAFSNAASGSISCLARLADGTATDTPTLQWTGTNDAYAWIESYYGDVWQTLATIIQDAMVIAESTTTGLAIPALTVTEDNALLVMLTQRAKTLTSNDATTITIPGGLTKRTQLIQTGTAVAAASASTQQTTAANYGGSDGTINGTAESTGSQGFILSLKSQATVTTDVPAFDVFPTVTSQTASAYTVGFTVDSNCTIYGVAITAGTTAPSIAQIKAGQNGSGGTPKAAASKSVSGADTLVLTPSDSPKYPLYDLYIVLSNANGDSAREVLGSEWLDAPSGKQFITLTSVHPTSPFVSFATASDIVVIDLLTPSGYTVTCDTDGTVSYAANGDTSRQIVAADVYHYGNPGYEGAGTLVFNNQPPDEVVFINPLLYRRNVAITAINLSTGATDPEGDTITVTALDALPAGLAITASVLDDTGGGPTAYGETTTTLQYTDTYGATTTAGLTIQVGDQVPDVDSGSVSQATAISTIQAVANFTVVLGPGQFSGTVAAGNVISQSPSAGTLVPYNQIVTLVISSAAGTPATDSRWLDALNAAAAAGQVVGPVVFVDLDISGGHLYLNDSNCDLVWGGHTWLGRGEFGGIDGVVESPDLIAQPVVMTLTGVDQQYISDAAGTLYKDRPAYLYLGLLNADTYNFVAAPEEIWRGTMDLMVIEIDHGKGEITLTCENILRSPPAVSRQTDEEQQVLSAGDRYYQHTYRVGEIGKWGLRDVSYGGGGNGRNGPSPRDRRQPV